MREVVRVDYHCIVMVPDPEDEMVDKALSFLDFMVKESEGDLVGVPVVQLDKSTYDQTLTEDRSTHLVERASETKASISLRVGHHIHHQRHS
jgi:hypothetical protein